MEPIEAPCASSKQVVAGSSPAAPTNSFSHMQQKSTSYGGPCDVTPQFAFPTARWLSRRPSIKPLVQNLMDRA